MKRKILVVEDDFSTLSQLEHDLISMNFEVVKASDRQEAIGLFESQMIDVALLEPELNQDRYAGVYIANYIRSRSSVPIIYMTPAEAYQQYSAFDVFDVLPNSYLPKPHNPNVLRQTLGLVLFNYLNRKTERSTIPAVPVSFPDQPLKDVIYITQSHLEPDGTGNYRLCRNQKINGKCRVLVTDIIWVQSKNGRVFIKTEDHCFNDRGRNLEERDCYCLSIKLSEFEKQVANSLLRRVSKSALINVRRVREIHGSLVTMEDLTPINITDEEVLKEFSNQIIIANPRRRGSR